MTRFRTWAKVVFNPLTLLIIVAMMTPAAYGRLESANPYSTPTPVADERATPMQDSFFDGARLEAISRPGEEVEWYIWDEEAAEIDGSGLAPVSFAIGNVNEHVWVFAEFRNNTQFYLNIPELTIEATYNGRSFGQEYPYSPQPFVAPGESVFYIGDDLYQGAILLGDWDGLKVTLSSAGLIRSPSTLPLLRLSEEEMRVYNEGSQDVSGVSILGIARNLSGHFVGLCSMGRIDATVRAGLFVRIPSEIGVEMLMRSGCGEESISFARRSSGDRDMFSFDGFLAIP